MVDDKLDDQVWVTVVATGFGEARRPPRRTIEEPAGEPRVARRSSGERETARPGLAGVTNLDVPEFMPRR
jgi:cell division protein FtsZ